MYNICERKENNSKAQKELQRIKIYLTKNNVFSAEDFAVIVKDEEEQDSNSKPSEKMSRKVSCNALRVVIKVLEFLNRRTWSA